jgi:hypothetical protein
MFSVVSVRTHHFNAAAKLVRTYGHEGGLRSLDAIQLAVAADLTRYSLADFFLTSDTALYRVAAMEGLQVFNPSVAL